MKVLVACEFSGIVRDAFAERGHRATSCDILPSERPGEHIQGDVRRLLREPWDLVIAHPPCTYLTNAGVRWLWKQGRKWLGENKTIENDIDPERWGGLYEGVKFFKECLEANAPKVAVENPIMHKYARAMVGRGPDCITHPWEHGLGESKAICWWTRNLPPLEPTNIVAGRTPKVHHASPGPDRWKERSRFFEGVAAAMAEQWG